VHAPVHRRRRARQRGRAARGRHGRRGDPAGWINHAIWFVDEKWAYTGWAEGKKPPAHRDQKLRMEPLTLPRKGARLGLDLHHQNWSGACAITCTAYTDYLTMDTGGRFVEGGFSVGSWPGLGSSWSSVPADQRGTYRVVSTGIVELVYADGTRKREVIGIQHDPSGKPNPAVAGVLLGDTNFYD